MAKWIAEMVVDVVAIIALTVLMALDKLDAMTGVPFIMLIAGVAMSNKAKDLKRGGVATIALLLIGALGSSSARAKGADKPPSPRDSQAEIDNAA